MNSTSDRPRQNKANSGGRPTVQNKANSRGRPRPQQWVVQNKANFGQSGWDRRTKRVKQTQFGGSNAQNEPNFEGSERDARGALRHRHLADATLNRLFTHSLRPH